MTCYLRMHEVAVAVRTDAGCTDWEHVMELWRSASGVGGRDDAVDAMPVDLIELDDLPVSDLAPYAGLILSGRCDQRLLAQSPDLIGELLDRGGAVVFSGQLTHPWLPGTAAFEHSEPPPEADAPTRLAAHPVFAEISAEDLGGSFLYRHGWHPPPPGAEVIAWRGDGTPGAYVDRVTSGGTVLVHGGANLLANATGTGSGTRIVPQLVEWVTQVSR